jgi:4-amino-4-deoxy-L-arabinose transferase-like glycosyltransferase
MTRQHRSILLSIIFIGLISRIALVSYVSPYPERYIQADATGYNQLAINLLSGHGFSMETTTPFAPDNFRTPVYPLTIALFYTTFGYRPDLILWLQVLMAMFTVLLTFLLADRIGGPRVGLIAAGLLAISPHSVTYVALLWSDTAYTMFFTLSILLTAFMFIEIKFKWVFFAGLFSGISVLTHPRSIYLPFLFAILLVAVMVRRKMPLRQTLIYAGIYLLVFNLALLPWRLRNNIVFGIPNITSAAGINMLHYGAALTESTLTGEDQWLIADRYDNEVRQMSLHSLNAAEYGDSAFKLGLKKILQHPFTYTKVHIIGMAKIFLPGTIQINTLLTGQNTLNTAKIYALFSARGDLQPMVQSLSGYSIFTWCYIGFEIFYLCSIYFLSLYALIKQNHSFPWLWFIVFVLFYLAVVAGPAGAPRFRVVMMPLFSILAAYGIPSTPFWVRKTGLPGKSTLSD